MIVADKSQSITAGESVLIEYIFDNRQWTNEARVSLGSALVTSFNGQEIQFEENIITGFEQFDNYALRFCKIGRAHV